MTRFEEKALIHAVLTIGMKISAMKPDPVYANPNEVTGSAMFYTVDNNIELQVSLMTLRNILDGKK